MAQNRNANWTSIRPHRPRQLHAVSDTAPKPAKPSSPGKQALLAALGNHPHGHGTAAELAHQAQIGQSTARRLLGELTEEGLITRLHGAGRGPGRTPAQFRLATDREDHTGSEAGPVASLAVVSTDERAHGHAETTNIAENPPEPALQPDLGEGSGITARDETTPHEGPVDETGERDETGRDHEYTASPSSSDHDPAAGAGARVRLGRNALRGKVEQYLIEHPDDEFGPHALGQALGHSSGAISNVLDRLVTAGNARQTQASPKRFTASTDPDS